MDDIGENEAGYTADEIEAPKKVEEEEKEADYTTKPAAAPPPVDDGKMEQQISAEIPSTGITAESTDVISVP